MEFLEQFVLSYHTEPSLSIPIPWALLSFQYTYRKDCSLINSIGPCSNIDLIALFQAVFWCIHEIGFRFSRTLSSSKDFDNRPLTNEDLGPFSHAPWGLSEQCTSPQSQDWPSYASLSEPIPALASIGIYTHKSKMGRSSLKLILWFCPRFDVCRLLCIAIPDFW